MNMMGKEFHQILVAKGMVKKSTWVEDTIREQKEMPWLEYSQEIAMRVLESMGNKGWNQTDLAREMDMSIEELKTYLKGRHDFKISLIYKFEQVLDDKLLDLDLDI